MKIATWNVNGIRARQAEAQEWIARERPDVVCLQELKASSAQLPAAMCEMEGYWCYWHGEKGYSGVGLHIDKTLSPEKPEFSHPPFDFENRIVCARIGALTVASVYVPNGGKDYDAKLRFVEALDGFAASFQATQAPLLICGDLNIARTDMDIHPRERKANGIGQRPDERTLLEGVIAHGLVDVGRAVDPENADLFTWWAPWRNLRQRNVGWRIDYILASEALYRQTRACVVQREVGTSDHAPVLATFDIEPGSARGPATEER
jgi:exodeoxyribonuclease-3